MFNSLYLYLDNLKSQDSTCTDIYVVRTAPKHLKVSELSAKGNVKYNVCSTYSTGFAQFEQNL